MHRLHTGILLITLPCCGALAQLDLGHPLSGLEKLKDFRTMRASSAAPDWRNGNGDCRWIKPGGELTLAELTGPGRIVHIWCTIAHQEPFYSRRLTLRMYWDGETHPSVECPIGDFFGIGHGVDHPFTSLPVRVSSDGRGRNCYWPMPFRKSARLVVSNECDRPCDAFYYYVDWQQLPALPGDSAYFRARYRQEFPCVMGQNYLLADIQGRGHYVGTVQSVYLTSPGWYGEGNDLFFIDGEKEPSLRGTGTEDYFCDGWGFREQSGPFYGTPLWEGYSAGAIVAASGSISIITPGIPALGGRQRPISTRWSRWFARWRWQPGVSRQAGCRAAGSDPRRRNGPAARKPGGPSCVLGAMVRR
jgi:hypothetical protein